MSSMRVSFHFNLQVGSSSVSARLHCGAKSAKMGSSHLCLHYCHYQSAAGFAAFHRTAKALLSKPSSTLLGRRRHHHRCFYRNTASAASAACNTSKEIRSTDLVALEFAELNLPVSNKIAGVLFYFIPLLSEFYSAFLYCVLIGVVAGAGSWENQAACQSSKFVFHCMHSIKNYDEIFMLCFQLSSILNYS